jgi:hypothetical protein
MAPNKVAWAIVNGLDETWHSPIWKGPDPGLHGSDLTQASDVSDC